MATKGSDLKDLVGGTIEVELLNGTAFIAELFGYDAITRTAVFQERLAHTTLKSTVRFVKDSTIKDFKWIKPAPGSIDKLPHLSQELLLQREAKALAAAKRSSEQIGVGVSPFAQALFDRLNRTMSCVWRGKNIEVLGSVTVEPPYTPASCRGKDENALARVKKVVSLEGARLKDFSKDSQ